MVPREQSIRIICRYIMIKSHEALCLFLPTRQLFPFDVLPLSGAARVPVTLFGPAVSFARCDLSTVHSKSLQQDCGIPQAGLVDICFAGSLVWHIQIDS